MALSVFVLPALLVFAFVQLFLIVRITFVPVWSSFKDFLLLLLLFFPIVSGFCRFESKFLGELFISLAAGSASADLLFT